MYPKTIVNPKSVARAVSAAAMALVVAASLAVGAVPSASAKTHKTSPEQQARLTDVAADFSDRAGDAIDKVLDAADDDGEEAGAEDGSANPAGSPAGSTVAASGATDAEAASAADTLTAKVDRASSTVTLTASGGKVGRASNVAFFVTGDGSADHETTTWYQAEKQSDGTWATTFDASENGTGVCQAQTFLTVGGSTDGYATARFSAAGIAGNVVVAGPDAQMHVTLTATGVRCDGKVQGVSVEVRLDDATRTYEFAANGQGVWTATVPLTDFDVDQGIYRFSTAVRDASGTETPVDFSTLDVVFDGPSTVDTDLDRSGGYLWLAARGGVVEEAENVAFCVTDAYGTSSWVQGERQDDGSWAGCTAISWLAHGHGYATAYAGFGTDETAVVGGDSFYQAGGGESAMTSRIQGYSSPTGYLIALNTSDCLLGVYSGYQGNWTLVHYWECTCGAWDTPTVTGVFSVGGRGYSFDSYGARCFYYTQFYGDYLFHSTCYWPTLDYPSSSNFLDSRTGMHLSHGCVRLDLDNALWIYNNIPSGTTVVSY